MGKRKVLVCGATGFLGRNIAEALASYDEFEVHATHYSRAPFKNSRISWHHANLTERATVNQLVEGMDIICHYAAIATNIKDVITRPYIHTTDNVVMASLLIRAAYEKKVSHFIFPSCGYLYNTSDTPFREDDVDYNNLPQKGYLGAAWSKVYLEKMCEFYAALGNTKFTVIRQANIYGPWDKLDMETAHALPATVMKVLNTKDGTIQVWGDGTQKRDQIYVSDLVEAIRLIIEKKTQPYDFMNIGSGYFVTMREIAEKIVAASDRNCKIAYDTTKPSSPMSWALDPTRAKRLLGWSPKVSLGEGIKRTYEWYRSVI